MNRIIDLIVILLGTVLVLMVVATVLAVICLAPAIILIGVVSSALGYGFYVGLHGFKPLRDLVSRKKGGAI